MVPPGENIRFRLGLRIKADLKRIGDPQLLDDLENDCAIYPHKAMVRKNGLRYGFLTVATTPSRKGGEYHYLYCERRPNTTYLLSVKEVSGGGTYPEKAIEEFENIIKGL